MCDIGIEHCEVDFEPVDRELSTEPEQARPVPTPASESDPPARTPATASS